MNEAKDRPNECSELELIGIMKDMTDREKRVGNLLLRIAQKLKDLETRIEKLEGQNNE